MKATLCLLEVSRHGLLEFELLALLGDENNIVCPEYKEVGVHVQLGISNFDYLMEIDFRSENVFVFLVDFA